MKRKINQREKRHILKVGKEDLQISGVTEEEN